MPARMDKRTQPELIFRSLVRSLPAVEGLRLLARMRSAMGKPQPERVWCVVRVTGGCDVLISGEAAGD